MKNGLLLLVLACSLSACQVSSSSPTTTPEANNTFSICFGSCSHQDKPQPILDLVAARRPDLFLYLGDNIYGDTEDMTVLQKKYQKLGSKTEFQNLQKSTTVLATWDDHDYGENDAGRYYPYKEKSKEIFLDFWKEPQNSERRKHKGIYHSYFFDYQGKKIQIVLLDTRTFRDKLTHLEDKKKYKNDYQPTSSPDSTFLGEQQWQWLKKQFQKKAAVRIIASSNQFAHEYNGWESWTNVPHERNKMLQLIQATKAQGIVFLSGDVHWGEISKLQNDYTYPIYDVTSSGITQNWPDTEPNKNRIGQVVRKNNYGMITIQKQKKKLHLTLQLRNKKDEVVVEQDVPLDSLRF